MQTVEKDYIKEVVGTYAFGPDMEEILRAAKAQAVEHQNNFIGTEHLLLALLEKGVSQIVFVLESIYKVQASRVKEELLRHMGRGPQGAVESIPFTPRAKKVLSLACKEAKGEQTETVRPIHLFFALLKEGDGLAPRVLKGLGVTYHEAQELVSTDVGGMVHSCILIVAACKHSQPAPIRVSLEQVRKDLFQVLESTSMAVGKEKVLSVLDEAVCNFITPHTCLLSGCLEVYKTLLTDTGVEPHLQKLIGSTFWGRKERFGALLQLHTGRPVNMEVDFFHS